jgi:hypothetical protein
MKLSFRARTFSRLGTWLCRTLAGGDPLVRVPMRTAAGEVVPVGTKQAGQVARPWGAVASAVYIAGAAEGESYA